MDMLLFQLEKHTNKSLYEQLYSGIKQAIISNKIGIGTKLPSKRKLATFLNISQTTIEIAYAQLLAEGYISSTPRVGYFVEEIDTLPYIQKDELPIITQHTSNKTFEIDFHPGAIDIDSFPFTAWRKYAKELLDEHHNHLLLSGHPQGEYALRLEISNYLFQSRGVLCTPEQIVIGSGTEQLLPMIIRLFDDTAQFAIENPGYQTVHRIFTQHKRIVYPVPVDEDGIIIRELEEINANVVYITPSHQFPTGAVLSASRRTQALKWALKQSNRYIVEDDFDSEFRYSGRPIPSLQGLDQNEKVIYMSTFTKSLMPSLRVAYFVLPKNLLVKYHDTLSYYSATVPRFDQHILANFMHDGHFAKHLNRMRKLYSKKHDKLTAILETHYPSIKISGEDAGMHILITVPRETTEQYLKQLANNEGINVYPLSDYIIEPVQYSFPKFLLGFGGLPLEKIEPAIHKLMLTWNIEKQPSRL